MLALPCPPHMFVPPGRRHDVEDDGRASPIAHKPVEASDVCTAVTSVQSGPSVKSAKSAQSVKSGKSTKSGKSEKSTEQTSTAPDPVGREASPAQTIDQWAVAAFVLAFVLPNLVLVLFLSDIGFGRPLYDALAPVGANLVGNVLIAILSLGAAALYVVDAGSWQRRQQAVSAVTIWLLLLLACLLKARLYPWAPLFCVLLHTPVACGMLRKTVCAQLPRAVFYAHVAGLAAFSAVVLVVTWVGWLFNKDRPWEFRTIEEMARHSDTLYGSVYSKRALVWVDDCGPDKNLAGLSQETRTNIGMACKQANTVLFTCWCSPFVATVANVLLAIAGTFNSTQLHSPDSLKIERYLKRLVGLLAFTLLGMYFTVLVSGAALHLGTTLAASFAAALAMLCGILYVELGRQQVQEHLHKSKTLQALVKAYASDWSRALLVWGFNICLPAFLCLDVLRQAWRRRHAGALDGAGSGRWFTANGQRVYAELQTWNWASILLKVCLLGELFFTFQVGVAKATYVFLSWLNSALSSVPYGMVLLIVFIIGATMFLLPPVPGGPVYILCGIVVAERGRQLESVGFWLGCAIAVVLSTVIKLVSCVGQYYIGYYLGRSVKVQQMVQVDKVPTRALERFLQAPGLSIGKSAVLVGGPDWPTSVLCGILRVNVPQMVLGTTPIIIVTGPSCLGGAFLGRVEDGNDSIWSALAASFLLVGAAIQAASMFIAFYLVMQVVERHHEELSQPRPEHEAVAALTAAEARSNEVYREVAAWPQLRLFHKVLIAGAGGIMLLSCFIFAMGGEYCFRSFSVSSKIDAPFQENGLNGDALNIVLPLGWLAIGLFFVAALLHAAFVLLLNQVAQRRLAADVLQLEQRAGGSEAEVDPRPPPQLAEMPPADPPAGA